jgi:pimeloyl-ACP methyl ester carboxylesterase
MPNGPTPADQADAFVALLDALGISAVDVVGISAGTTSVLQLALRHPKRLKHLVVLSGNLPGSPTAVVQPCWARLVNRQLPMWALKVFAPATMAFLAGVPRGLPMTRRRISFVAEFIESLFPVSRNLAGVAFDAFVSNVDVNSYELETIRAPTLLIHAKDDPLVSYDAAERAASRIQGARLVSLDSGGHLMVGQPNTVRNELASFLSEHIAD